MYRSDDFTNIPDNYEHIEDSWAAVSADDVAAHGPLRDQLIASEAIERLRQLASSYWENSQPFFLAVGFYKPHLPFVFPEPYLYYYPPEVVEMPLTQSVPVQFPPVAWNRCGGLCDKPDVMASCEYNETLPDSKTLELRRAYYRYASW